MTFDGSNNNSTDDNDTCDSGEGFMHAPSTPLLNHFAAHIVRSAHDSPAKMSTAAELSPILTDCLPSEAAVVDLYTQISTGQKHAEPAAKPVRGLHGYYDVK